MNMNHSDPSYLKYKEKNYLKKNKNKNTSNAESPDRQTRPT
jgi:hypothetical protein